MDLVPLLGKKIVLVFKMNLFMIVGKLNSPYLTQLQTRPRYR